MSEKFSPKSPAWAKAYGGSENDMIQMVKKISNDEYILIGETRSFGAGIYDFWIVKINSNGDILWSKTYGGTDGDYPSSIVNTSDGGYVITGYTESFGAGNYDSLIIKLNSDGNLSWAKTYGGSDDDQINSIIQTSDGGFIAAGYTESFGVEYGDFLLMKLNSNGEVVWGKAYGGSEWDEAISITETSDGGFIATGITNSFGAGDYDFLIIKFNSTGDVIWAKTLGGISDDESNTVIQSTDGNYIISGYTYSFGAGNYDFIIAKLDSDGNRVWVKTYGGNNEEREYSIIETSDNGFAVVGSTNSFGNGNEDCLIMKLDSGGNLTWAKTFGEHSIDRKKSIIQTSDGGYLVGGYSSSFGVAYDFLVTKLTSNGEIHNCQYILNCTPSISSITLNSTSQVLTVTTLNITASTQTISTSDPNPTTTDICVEKADLSIEKSDDPDPTIAGNQLTYTITITNNGPDNAEGVIVNDNTPQEFKNPEYSIDTGNTWNNWNGSLNIGNLSNGENFQLLIRGTVDSSTNGTISNRASVSSGTSDPNDSNNSATENTTINSSADLYISKEDSPDPVTPGDYIVYTITTTNNGPSEAQNVVITDNIPISKIITPTYSIDGGNNWNTWNGNLNVGNISSGNNFQLLIRGKVRTVATGTIENTTSVSSDTYDPDTSNNSDMENTTINSQTPSADLSITKSDNPDPVYAGKTINYKITVTNNGPEVAENVVISDNIPPEILGSMYSINDGNTWSNWNGTLSIGDLSNGKSFKLLLMGSISPSAKGLILNKAEVSSTTNDPNNSNNTATEKTNVIGNCHINFDINGDGSVNITDLLNLLNIISGNLPSNSRCDLNCDGNVDISDGEILAQYLVSNLF